MLLQLVEVVLDLEKGACLKMRKGAGVAFVAVGEEKMTTAGFVVP